MKVYERYPTVFWSAAFAAMAVWVCLIWFGPLRFLLEKDLAGAGLFVSAFCGWLAATIHAGRETEKD